LQQSLLVPSATCLKKFKTPVKLTDEEKDLFRVLKECIQLEHLELPEIEYSRAIIQGVPRKAASSYEHSGVSYLGFQPPHLQEYGKIVRLFGCRVGSSFRAESPPLYTYSPPVVSSVKKHIKPPYFFVAKVLLLHVLDTDPMVNYLLTVVEDQQYILLPLENLFYCHICPSFSQEQTQNRLVRTGRYKNRSIGR